MNKAELKAFYPFTLAVRRLFHKLGYGVAALHRDSDVSVGMRAVLESVVDGGPQTVPQMARVRPVTRQHIQGLVNALMEGGYVEYADNPAHKRSKLVCATKLGEEVFRALRERENAAFLRARIDVSAEDLESATKVLRALIATLEGPEWRSVLNHFSTENEAKTNAFTR